MATITYIPEKTQSKTAMGKVMRYCAKKDKTAFELDGRKFQLISGKDCVAETAFKEFMATKQQYGKESGMFFYQYVQSFSPEEKITPQMAHEIGCKFAEYFKGYEVLIATHTDREHLHTHFIINSVSHDTGKKLQMARGSIHKLRQFSDEICKQYGLSIVQPKEQKSGVKTREYRAALKGESWKFKLINAVDSAMANSRSKAEFIKQMRKMGYQVKWQDNLKHITYTTPDGNKCRDNKLHDEKYLKERMEVFYELRQAQGFEQAGEFDRPIQYQVESVRNPAGNARTAFNAPVRDRAGANSHAAANQQAAELGGVDRESDSGNRQDIGIQQRQNCQLREKPAVGFSESDECAELGGQENDNGADNGIGENAQSAGLVRLETPAQMDGGGRDAAAVVLGAALALGSLVSQPEDEQQKKYVPKAGKRHKRRRKQTISHNRDDWDMEL